MDNPTTLLVAIMFVTIVVTGIVNILMFLSEGLAGKFETPPLHTHWIVLLLLAYLNFFWHTTLILDIEGWTFLGFMGFIIGPVALLFASSQIVIVPAGDTPAEPERQFFQAARRFFLLMAGVQAWVVCLDFVFGDTGYLTWLAAALAVLFGVLAFTERRGIHHLGVTLAWAGFLLRAVIMSF
jgi:hypothetical protein